MKIKHADMRIVPATNTFAALILNRFLFQNTPALGNGSNKIFSPIRICSLIAHALMV